LFWRASIKNVAKDYFEKEYAYKIRHLYGQVGKKKDY
jgi:DNA primase large subunit